jgi:serine/threonine protein kinase/Tfp pilus assembly protein PilF
MSLDDREENLLTAAEAVADRTPFDWVTLESRLNQADRAILNEMRVIAGIVQNQHRGQARGLSRLRLAMSVADGQISHISPQQKLRDPTDSAFTRELRLVAELAAFNRDHGRPQSHSTLESPKQWGPLELREKIGEGAFGTVYKGYDPRLARELAVKLIPSAHGISGASSAEVLREGRLLARVRHTNVVTVFGADSFDGVVGIWMEYVEGRSLADIVRTTGPYGPREALLVGVDLARALAAVHAAGLVHGDIKTQNVMRAAGGRTVLMDFGAGRDLPTDGDDLPVAITGTPLYMAPEVFASGRGSVRSDIYSLGVLLDHLVSGTFPIAAQTLSDVRAAHRDGRRRLLRDARPDLPSAFIRVVQRATAISPEARYESAGALEAALTVALGECDEVPSHHVADEQHEPHTHTQRTSRFQTAASKWLTASAFLTIAIVAAGSYFWNRSQSVPASSVRSIAVLPLKNESGNTEYDYFAEGMTDLLTGGLSKIKPLHVASRTSAMTLAENEGRIPEIAKRLNVDTIIDGSVRLDGDHVRLSVRLLYAGSGNPSWVRLYERNVAGILALEGDVVRDIARRLDIALTPAEQRDLTQNRVVRPEAQDAYFRGRHYQYQTSREGAERAVAYYEEAVRADPNYPQPYAALATSYIILNAFGAMSTEETIGRARAAIDKALKLDDQLPEVHVALGDIYFLHDWNWHGAEDAYQRAIDLNASYAYAYAEYAWFLAARGRLDEALQMMYQAEQRDPLSLLMKSNVAGVLYYAHRFDEALIKCREILQIDPTFGMAHRRLMQLYVEKKMFNEALASGRRVLQITGPDPGTLADFARVHALAGNVSEAERLMRDLEAAPAKIGRIVSSDRLAFVHLALGDQDIALNLLQRALSERAANIPWLLVDPHYDSLRGDPRFERLLEQLNLHGRMN